MTQPKIDAKIPKGVTDALEPYVEPIAVQLRAGKIRRVPIVGELVPVERTEPAPGEAKEQTVKLRLGSAEIPTEEQEEYVRQAQRALYLQRTATGTLNADGEVELSRGALQAAGGQIAYLTAARYRAALDYWAKETRKATHARLDAGELWHELERVADGLAAALGLDKDQGDEEDTARGDN